ncbi:MAG: hypothetical protein QOG55_3745 [Acidobacteriaceae bacterium]|nr:hypothetical protein [Acidobacteriaceae bacterium]
MFPDHDNPASTTASGAAAAAAPEAHSAAGTETQEQKNEVKHEGDSSTAGGHGEDRAAVPQAGPHERTLSRHGADRAPAMQST